MTGNLAAGRSAGRQTFSTRQSSAGGVPSGAASPGNGSCAQSLPYARAGFAPVHGLTGCGGRQRSSPTGGAAYGMPLNELTPASTAPSSIPLATLTCSVPARIGSVAETAAAIVTANATVSLCSIVAPSFESAGLGHLAVHA